MLSRFVMSPRSSVGQYITYYIQVGHNNVPYMKYLPSSLHTWRWTTERWSFGLFLQFRSILWLNTSKIWRNMCRRTWRACCPSLKRWNEREFSPGTRSGEITGSSILESRFSWTAKMADLLSLKNIASYVKTSSGRIVLQRTDVLHTTFVESELFIKLQLPTRYKLREYLLLWDFCANRSRLALLLMRMI